MSIEVRAFAAKCNIQCTYCYQNAERASQPADASYNLDKILGALEEEDEPFSLFGGEPLLMPIGDLEKLWEWGYARYGRNALQTNGTLITDEHIRLFQTYNVDVGISLDGPVSLNDARSAGVLRRTRAMTAHVESAIAQLCREHRPPSLIVTLHRMNACADKLPAMCAWFKQLHAIGLRRIRLHLLEVDHPEVRSTLALSDRENIDALMAFRTLSVALDGLVMDLFHEMRSLLLGDDRRVSCVWRACDPYTTAGVCGIEGDGTRSSCGRTQKEGVRYVKSRRVSYDRYITLWGTPQEAGGCQGCRFFLMCKGQCPGTGIDSDWRNRSEHCAVFFTLFENIEHEIAREGLIPISQLARRTEVEQAMLQCWSQGMNPSLMQVIGMIDPHYLLTRKRKSLEAV